MFGKQTQLALTTALALGLSPAAFAGGGGAVQFGDVITQPGLYYLDGNQSGSGCGVRIESDWVTLHLGLFTLSGDGSEAGIEAEGRRGIAIIGGRITNFEDGIALDACRRSVIKGVRVDNNSEVGVDLDHCMYVTVSRVESSYNGDDGFEVEDCESNLFLGLRAHHNGDDGIDLSSEFDPAEAGTGGNGQGSNRNVIHGGSFNHNDDDGIDIESSSRNRVTHNSCHGNGDAGIALETGDDSGGGGSSGGSSGANQNLIQSNLCTGNDLGIEVRWGSVQNHILANTALGNDVDDLVEENEECPNWWFLNLHVSVGGLGQDCIQ